MLVKTIASITLFIGLYSLKLVIDYFSFYSSFGLVEFWLPRLIIFLCASVGALYLFADKLLGYIACLVGWCVVLITISGFSLLGLFNGGVTTLLSVLSLTIISLLGIQLFQKYSE